MAKKAIIQPIQPDQQIDLAKNETIGKKKPSTYILLSDDDDDDDEEEEDTPPVIQKPKKVLTDNQKPKKALTDKQKEALDKGKEKRKANVLVIREQKQKAEEEYKRATEEKIIKKAIAIKKKEIKKNALLDAVSDDETPIEEIKAIKKRQQKPQPIKVEPPKPKYFYV
jgi:hypothetical protein